MYQCIFSRGRFPPVTALKFLGTTLLSPLILSWRGKVGRKLLRRGHGGSGELRCPLLPLLNISPFL